MSKIQWLFDMTRNRRLAHAFTDTRITTLSLCDEYRTAFGGPWVFALDTTPHCTDCEKKHSELKDKKE
jgi:hypothetical protein